MRHDFRQRARICFAIDVFQFGDGFDWGHGVLRRFGGCFADNTYTAIFENPFDKKEGAQKLLQVFACY